MPQIIPRSFALLITLVLVACAERDQPAGETPFFQDPTVQGKSCRPSVDQELAKLGVPQDQVESMTFRRRESATLFGGFSSRNIEGFDAWVRPKGVAGHLVVQMFLNCSVQSVYTRGDYKLDGVKHY